MERMKMPRSQRAKQFMPFDALKGYKEALRLKEYLHEREPKIDIPEDKAQEINDTLCRLSIGDVVEIKYYYDGYVHYLRGISKLFVFERYIEVCNTKIYLDDIYDIRQVL